MPDDDTGLREKGGEAFGDGLDGFHAIVQVENLAATGKLGLDGIADQALIEATHDGADGQPLARRGFDDAEIAGADEREVERPGDGCRAHGQHVHLRT